LILVAGGAGYVGSVLVPELLARGHRVRVLDKLLFGDGGLAAVRDRIELVVADVRRFDPAVLDGVSAVVNLSGLSNDPMAEFDPRANHEMNTVATARLAEAARARGVRRFVQGSSCSIYDRGLEAEDVLRDETSDVKPRAAYAVSKHDAERALLEMAGADFCPVILRKGTIYGFSPRMRYDLVVNTFVRDALSGGRLTVHHGGEMWRPLVDVRDAALAYVAALAADDAVCNGQVFNVVERNYRILELAYAVKEALRPAREIEIDVRFGGGPARSYRVSGRKAEAVLGYRPEISVADSVRDMLRRIPEAGYTDYASPRYNNIEWFKLLVEAERMVARTGSVL